MNKERDQVFKTPSVGGFEFNEEVADVFDDMLARSIPLYYEQQQLISTIAQQFYVPGTRAIDLGCSTGNTLRQLANTLGEEAPLCGYDYSLPMLDKARAHLKSAGVGERIQLIHADLNNDLESLDFSNTSVITMCWTLQFIRPLKRDALIRRIYDSLVKGGVLIVTEKVLANDSNMNRFFIDFYYDFKRANGYSEVEIARKREALENTLVPYRTDENFELFRRNGFEIAETFFQWFNFAGFMCVKNPS